MKLIDFLTEAYSNERGESYRSIKYALKYLSYLDWGNESLSTNDIHYLGDERLNNLTGEEVLEKGFYTLWTGAHDGIEWLQRFETCDDALEIKKGWNANKFSPCDNCVLIEVK